jgi:peroxiredoxin
LSGIDGLPVDLIEIAAGRPVVLILTRGARCPTSIATLQTCAEALPRIEAAGGMLIAVTPDRAGRAFDTAPHDDRRFAVAVDHGCRFAKSLGLVASWPQALGPRNREPGIDRPAHNGDESAERPVPATYVLAPCGRVTWACVDPDPTRGADPDDIVAALWRLAALPADDDQGAPFDAWESIR